MRIDISFPGGLAVDASFAGHVVRTDQPVSGGGLDAGPSPFDLFLASIGTCAGYYAARFVEHRGFDPGEMSMRLETERDEGSKRIRSIRLEIRLPAGFPSRLHRAVLRSVDQCTVKRHLLDPPNIEVVVDQSEQSE